MARRTFVVVDITEIYIRWYAGRSKSALAASLGVDHPPAAARRAQASGVDLLLPPLGARHAAG
jgi:hypothetical protein